ncbi:hypothetical protein ABPG75_012742 [Micractinium tetrahymenae]
MPLLPMPPLPTLEELHLESQQADAACLQAIAAHTSLTHLRLACCGLREVPAGFSGLTALRYLDLSDNNELCGGWQHLASCTSLTCLCLFDQSMAEVPPALAGLTGLQALALGRHNEDGYELCSGLQHLAGLTGLTRLSLALDQDVPLSATATLTGLLDLSVFSRFLLCEVHAIAAMHQLTSLSLHETADLLAPWLSGLTALRELTVTGWGTDFAAPDAWDCLLPLRRLTRLDLGSILGAVRLVLHWLTQLRQLRIWCGYLGDEAGWEHLSNLSQLEELDISVTDVTALPAAISCLTALCSLDVARTRIQRLPAWLASLPRLTSLVLGGCEELVDVEHLSGLTSLSKLCLVHCQQAPWPASLGMLRGLRDLTIWCSPCMESSSSVQDWSPLECLGSLTRLSLPFGRLTVLPAAMSSLTLLERLELQWSRVTCGWEHLLPLRSLRTVATSRDSEASMPPWLRARLRL